MSAYCCEPGCIKRIGSHQFPKDKELRKKWVIGIKRENLGGTKREPTPRAIVCYGHFLKDDYIEQTAVGG